MTKKIEEKNKNDFKRSYDNLMYPDYGNREANKADKVVRGTMHREW